MNRVVNEFYFFRLLTINSQRLTNITDDIEIYYNIGSIVMNYNIKYYD